jgi:hypothetical protein
MKRFNMRKIYQLFLLMVFSMLFVPMLSFADGDKTIKNKAVFLFSPKSQTKASLCIEFVSPDQQVIMVDWGEGNGIEEVTLDESHCINHVFTTDVEKYHVVTIDASAVTSVKDGDYNGSPIGLQAMDAPQMTSFSTSSNFYTTPDIDFSHLPKLQSASFNAISSFVAPDSLVSFTIYRSFSGNAPYLNSIDLSRARKLKTLHINQSSHKLTEIDLTHNKELTSLMISGSLNLSMKPTLTTIKGIKDLKKLSYCNLEYNALDFNNLLSNQPNSNPYIFSYDHQRFAIPKNKIGIARVDLSYLDEISNGVMEGTHKSTYEWYLEPQSAYDPLVDPIAPSYYEEKGGVFMFKPGAFGEGVSRAKIVCKVSNDAYPTFSNSYSAPVAVSLVDDNHCVFVSDGAYAGWVEPTYELYTEKEENGQWLLDKKINNGDRVEPGSHVVVKALWTYEMIIDNWVLNDEIVTEQIDGKDRPFRGATLHFVMPDEGSVEVVPNFTQIVVSWKVFVPSGVTDEELSQFRVDVTKTKDGRTETVSGQQIGMTYGSDVNCSDALFSFRASSPKGYKVEKWYVNGVKVDTGGANMTYQTTPDMYSLKVDVKFQAMTNRYSVILSADPSEYAQKIVLKIKTLDGTYEDLSSEWVDEGSLVRAYVKPMDHCEIGKFIVNGEEYSGEVKDAGLEGQYIELTVDRDTEIIAKLSNLYGVITFEPIGDNAVNAKANITVTKQEKDSAGNWVEGEKVQSGESLAPGQYVKLLASYDKRYIIKQWIVNGSPLTGEETSVSYANPIYLQMPTEGDLKVTLELDKANMVSFITIPEGLSDKDKGKFSLSVSLGGKTLNGQEMSEGVKAYYVENLEGKTVRCEAKAAEGYIPEWKINGNKIDGNNFVIDVTAQKNLTIRLSFTKDNAVEKVSEGVNIYVANGQIGIIAREQSPYSVYTTGGHLLAQGKVGANGPLVSVKSGLYIVVINGTSYKVFVDTDR